MMSMSKGSDVRHTSATVTTTESSGSGNINCANKMVKHIFRQVVNVLIQQLG